MPVRIVLVDDHKVLREGLRLCLEQDPTFKVVGEAADATATYACVAEMKPDVVVMDIKLPGDSGLVATRRLRAEWPNLRILVLTGEVAPALAHDALLAGASGFVRKEDASEDLMKAVRVVMSGKTFLSPDAATAISELLRTQSRATKENELSDRELTVLKGLADGLSHKEIAEKLGVSVKSVETYRARLAKKTGSSSRAELVRYAVRKGIVVA